MGPTFVEASLLLGLAVLIRKPQAFGYGLATLLVFDALWAFGANLAFSAKEEYNRSEWRWALINLVTSALLILAFVYLDTLDPSAKPIETYRWRVLLTVAIGRTIWDYWWCWSYYYPSETKKAA